MFPPPQPDPPPPKKRTKPLLMSVGMVPTRSDFGAEADIVAPLGREPADLATRKWTGTIRAFLRAPLRIGIGPRNDGTEGDELHSPPRMVGFRSNEWDYIGLAPPPHASLYFTVENNRVSGNVILATDTMADAGYDNLAAIGGITQAYVTLKFPDLFGDSGGLAWTVGGFSNRYGNAGPYGKSTGYYGTYLFGRTHIAGQTLTADIDLSDDLELVLEHGIGAKIQVIPFIELTHVPPPPTAPYLPYQGPVPKGSNFVHHAHAALMIDETVTLGAHYLDSWTPNDFSQAVDSEEGRLTVLGGDIHLDGPKVGHGYVGYSYVRASDILPLANGVELLHSPDGFYFKQNYFGPLPSPTLMPTNDSGEVHTILSQYILRLAPLFGADAEGPDVTLAAFGMYNHITTYNLEQDRLKFGGEIQFAPFEFLSIGTRFDRVMPDGGNADPAYSALSPRLVLHTKWLSREYIILNYTRFFLGDRAFPSEREETPIPSLSYYPVLTKADPNLVTLTALVSF